MPCTRSMRSKTSKEVEQVEIKSPPKLRATRTRKGTKREDPSNSDVCAASSKGSDVPKSPATSVGSSSTRSGRTRTRAKVQPVEVEILEASSPSPPRARVTRPAKKKTTKGSKSKGAGARKRKQKEDKNEEENYEDNEEQVPLIPPSPEKLPEDEEDDVAPATVTKKHLNNNLPDKQIASGSAMGLATSQTKKKPQRKVRGKEKEEEFDIASTTDDDMEEIRQRNQKTLTVEELHKHFLNPFRTALQAVEVYPKFMERIMDTESARKQEDKFQELLKRNAMPPPPPPKTKGKGRPRKKRARSPEKTPSALEVPESFNFVPVPAKKKMIMDVAAVGSVDKAAGDNSQTAPNSTAGADDNSQTASISTAEPSLNAPKIDKAKNTDSKAKKKNVPTRALEDKEYGNAEPKSAEGEGDKQEKEKKTETSDATKSPPVCETPKDATKDSKESNEEFTPELFVVESPKLRNADKTIVISKNDSNNSAESNFEDKNKFINTPTSSVPQASSASGVVSSLVNFFSKSKKEVCAQEKSEVPAAPKTGNKKASGERAAAPDDILSDSVFEIIEPSNNDPNATYVVPPVNAGEKKKSPESMLNVTVCVKASSPEAESMPNIPAPPVQVSQPILPKNSKFLDKQDSPVSRSIIKDPPLAIVQEEDEAKDDRSSNKSEIARQPPPNKVTNKTDSKKGFSTSSSSSSASMKSASSQPCLTGIGKKPPASASKNAPSYASTGKLHEVARSKPLEDAEKRRKEFIQQKHENNKKKLEDWKKKTEKTKLEKQQEEDRKLKEKQKLMQTDSSRNLLKKPFPALKPQPASTAAFVKPPLFGQNKFPNVKPINAAGPSSFKPPTSKPPALYKPLPPPVEVDLDDSFKSANASTNSFLDTTGDAQLSSYDITIYEDLDEDLKHRENKTVPKWASNKESLTVALFSMIYLPEYQNKFSGTFPKPDKTYKLFPDK